MEIEIPLKYELNKQNFQSPYKTVKGSEGERCFYPTRLDTYGKGCFFNCEYCYAKNLLEFRGLWNPNNPAIANINSIGSIVDNIPQGSVVRLGGMTDCFQPLEKKCRLTYRTIKLLNKRKIHYLIVTKSDLILNDEYLKLMKKSLAHIQISIPTDNNKVLSMTDNAKSFEVRKRVVENLYELGFDVSLRLSPILYNTINYTKLNDIDIDKCLVEFLRIKSKNNRLSKILNLKDYTHYEGGYYHLPLIKKIQILSKLKFDEMSVCEDVPKHYHFFLNKFNHNPSDCCNLRL